MRFQPRISGFTPKRLELLALALLICGAAYGVLGYRPQSNVDSWAGYRKVKVVSGDCTRNLSWLPSLQVSPPGFIKYGDTTYIKQNKVVVAPEGMRSTTFQRRNWWLMRKGRNLYVQPFMMYKGKFLPLAEVVRYVPGSCG